jgi:hypothetical protein
MLVTTTNPVTLTTDEVAVLINKSSRMVRNNCVDGRYKDAQNSDGQWKIPLTSLNLGPVAELDYLKRHGLIDTSIATAAPDSDNTLIQLDALDGFRREKALWRKYAIDELNKAPSKDWDAIITKLSTTPGGEVFSRPTAYRWIAEYKKNGLFGLAPKWGMATKNTTTVPDIAGELFDSLALQESAPSYSDCYITTKGYMSRMYPTMVLPHLQSFKRRFDAKYPQHVQDFARKGYRFYQRNWEYYIPRKLDNLASGKGWFSDHHQLDTLVIMPDGTQVRPWITVWRDIRSGKMLAVFYHDAAPNSDHIFYAFYLAAEKYGLPDFIYIDNGKDYRCHDFAGIPGKHRIWDEPNEICARSLMGLLKVEIIFATAYNAQAKIVERDFQKIINQFAKFMLGYTGMNASKRPETTNKQCKQNELMHYTECKNLLNDYINNVFNKHPSEGKHLNGLSPDDAFNKHRKDIRTVSNDSLKLLLMRTSKEHSIGRNGINENELGMSLRYWAEWMFPLKGTKVYIRRDIQKYQTAWVWQADNNAFLGKAELAEAMDLRAIGDIDRGSLQIEIRRKATDIKNVKSAARRKVILNGTEIINAMANAQPEPTVVPIQHPRQILLTPLDAAIAQEERTKKTGTDDISYFVPVFDKKPKLLSEFGV